jgi:cyclomaltodextrinase / maltogenic alpha-amylase / neopullulanase
MKKKLLSSLLLLLLSATLLAADYVNITFRHYPTTTAVKRVFVPGTFNNWGPNSNGVIAVNSLSLMNYNDSLRCYVKTLRLQVGDTHYYKFHEHNNSSGTDFKWLTDPLNPLVNTSDNNNSILNVASAMIFERLPKDESTIIGESPTVVAGIFISESDSLLLDQSTITVDGSVLTTFVGNMIDSLSILSYKLPALTNGNHDLVIQAKTLDGKSAVDQSSFTLCMGDIIFLTPSIDSVWAKTKIIRWLVNIDYRKLDHVYLTPIGKTAIDIPIQTNGEYTYTANLSFGQNDFVITTKDEEGATTVSDTLRLNYAEPQQPQPKIEFLVKDNKIQVTGTGGDPQNGSVNFLWSNQNTNIAIIPNIDGTSASSFEIEIPTTPGDYALKLVATDTDGNSNSTVNFFTVKADGAVIVPVLATVPSWVADARIYGMFIKSYTTEGTIKAAAERLDHIKAMGFNVIWVLPVMDVEGVVDQGTNIGYNIIDFYNVEPAYGTNEDFKNFVQQAHELGLRIILDVTPNHSSHSHALALDVRAKRKLSRYYDFYQHEIISHNDNGLGQSISSDGIVYYTGFSDALLNWNWSDAEARQYMLEVYNYWLRDMDIDGFRFDVYWGPNRRYGVGSFDRPLRQALRAAKSDIMLLGETNGTGAGTELQYADLNGGLDLGYDWIFKDAILSFPGISNLNSNFYNVGYRPGPNSYFLRFLENQDEDRVAYRYNSIEKTMPVATALFLATGIPFLFQGQEVGMGYQVGGSKEYRLRSTVDWQNQNAEILAPHYQKLAQIRAQFPAFRRQFEDTNGDSQINSNDISTQPQLTTSSSSVYAFGRPCRDQNGVVVMNFSKNTLSATVDLKLNTWAEFASGLQSSQTYYVNNLYTNTSITKLGSELNQLQVDLPVYGVAIYTISTTSQQVQLPQLTVYVDEPYNNAEPQSMRLYPNYPNPFNGFTTISFDLPEMMDVSLEIYNVMGQKVTGWNLPMLTAGFHSVTWDGAKQNGVASTSGVYLFRLRANDQVEMKKMVFIK